MLCCHNTPNFDDCLGTAKYGKYCYKHRRSHLVIDDEIVMDRFTGLMKDYLISDIKHYHATKMNMVGTGKKPKLWTEMINHIYLIKVYTSVDYLNSITLIQSFIRNRTVRKKYENRLCNNNEDFYTYDHILSIPNKYFYSYIDLNSLRWGFDIRSLHKLFQMGYDNPYTTEMIPDSVKEVVEQKIEGLKSSASYEDLNEMIEKDRENTIKQKIVDLFSCIEQSGYTCQIDWFTSLSLRKLKRLYKELEDLWNYRLMLSDSMKRNICPPAADIFKTPLVEVMNYSEKEELQELILREVSKFIRAENSADRKLGFMYFLISFGTVSLQCYLAHVEWLGFMVNGPTQ